MKLDTVYQMLEQSILDAKTAGLSEDEVHGFVEDIYADGVSGQDRENYTDVQDRQNYTTEQ